MDFSAKDLADLATKFQQCKCRADKLVVTYRGYKRGVRQVFLMSMLAYQEECKLAVDSIGVGIVIDPTVLTSLRRLDQAIAHIETLGYTTESDPKEVEPFNSCTQDSSPQGHIQTKCQRVADQLSPRGKAKRRNQVLGSLTDKEHKLHPKMKKWLTVPMPEPCQPCINASYQCWDFLPSESKGACGTCQSCKIKCSLRSQVSVQSGHLQIDSSSTLMFCNSHLSDSDEASQSGAENIAQSGVGNDGGREGKSDHGAIDANNENTKQTVEEVESKGGNASYSNGSSLHCNIMAV
ncbi:hypothetical protein PILCRDRAFT_7986 [Piloderma croceum F 1598]|uniref:Uncharacterized protein n=1 Tax=Piloderma croceum (strain F 1598) TaxID=765440 RepID=A0A0C3B8P2_PILCF|nr:hypothetical protein PILCRDRAFT_7986 [Piloderma croceum F 1598]